MEILVSCIDILIVYNNFALGVCTSVEWVLTSLLLNIAHGVLEGPVLTIIHVMIPGELYNHRSWDTLSRFLEIYCMEYFAEGTFAKGSDYVPAALKFGIDDLVDDLHLTILLEQALGSELFLKFSLH